MSEPEWTPERVRETRARVHDGGTVASLLDTILAAWEERDRLASATSALRAEVERLRGLVAAP